jgi:CHAD domain-containing protein
MALRLSPGDQVGDAVRRLAHERLDPAVDALGSVDASNVDDVIHEVRKRCKRARAALRLIRDEVGEDVYRRENDALRDAGRLLSDVRDAAVLVEVHDDVVRAGAMPVPGFRTLLVERHEALRRQVLDDDTLPKVRAMLIAAAARIETWPLASAGWDPLAHGLERVYRRGRKAMAVAYDEPTTEHFHEWRKRAKYLRHQLAFLKGLWPEVVGGSTKAAHALSGILGDAHDLAVLEHTLADAKVHPEDEAALLFDFISSQREGLRAEARPIGLRLYAEKPSRFVGRLGSYWEASTTPATAA